MEHKSLRQRLTVNSLLIFFLAWLCSLLISFYNEFRDFDEMLINDIQLSIMEISTDFELLANDSEKNKIQQLIDYGKQWELTVGDLQLWYKQKLVYRSNEMALVAGIPSAMGYMETEHAAVYHHLFEDDEVNLVVSMWFTNKWDHLGAIVSESLIPLLLIFPIASLALFFSIGHSLKPLNSITSSISRRDSENLDSLSLDHLPSEVQPLVNALNQLLSKLNLAIENEKSFTMNAAHELLTPLAAIKSEVQLCQHQRKLLNDSTSISLNEISKRINRATHTVEQLVLLSRFEFKSEVFASDFNKVDVAKIIQEEIAELGNKIDDKALSFELSSFENQHTVISGNITSLKVLCRNLVDNAVRYTPIAGYIRIYFETPDDRLTLVIENSSNTLPPLFYDRIFQRFVRGPGEQESGSGLGLSIVQQIAHQHKAELKIDADTKGTGIKLSVSFPYNILV